MSPAEISNNMTGHKLPVQPPPKPFIGNLPLLTATGNLPTSMNKLLKDYNYEPVRLVVDKTEIYVACHPEIAEKMLSDQESFGKITHLAKRGPFFAARKAVGKALFTASDSEEEWGIAHRILMPAFTMRGMKPVVEIAKEATQNTIDNLATLGPDSPVEIGGLMTCITFDVIGKFAAGMEFNTTKNPSEAKTHPFLAAMETTMAGVGRTGASPILSKLDRGFIRSVRRSRDAMNAFVDDIIEDRRAGLAKPGAGGPPDLLDLMLTSADPETGKTMSPELIRQQILTFFVAGHDSTSSLLTSVFYFLTQHPEAEERMVAEIASVVGDGGTGVTYDVLKRLTFTTQVINESLRLNPPASGNQKVALRDTTAGGYFVKAGTSVFNSTLAMHTNPNIWGRDVMTFNPDRFSPEEVAKRHKFAFLPFSSGPRACIGMQLSLTEAKVALAMILPRFTFRLHRSARVHQDYSQIFAKFRDVHVTVHPRTHSSSSPSVPASLPAPLLRAPGSPESRPAEAASGDAPAVQSHGTPLKVFFGSNMGTCQGLAKQLASEAGRMGFTAGVYPLDAAPAELQSLQGTKGTALVVTSTYNGTPPDNARGFAKWADGLGAGALQGLSFGLLGVGNSNWKTYQVYPRRAAAALRAAGAVSLCPVGEADEEEDLDATAAAWARDFWRAALSHAGQGHLAGAAMSVAPAGPAVAQITVRPAPGGAKPTSCPEAVNWRARLGTVVAARQLQAPESQRHTRHLGIELPEGMEYSHGDHLAVLPANTPQLTLQVARLLGEELSRVVVLAGEAGSSEVASHLPFGQPVTVRSLLRDHVDLQAPVTDALLEAVAGAAQCPPEREALEAILAARRQQPDCSVGSPPDAVADLSQLRLAEVLGRFRSAQMSLAGVLPLLTPMKQRYYSISSAPAGPLGPRVASITVGLAEGPDGQACWQGVASGFLHSARPGDSVRVFVTSNDRFRLPADPSAPVLMVGPGTGLAPFMGFLQQMQAEGSSRRQASLFFGCRSQADFIYREELEGAGRDGSLEMLEVAFSRPAGGTQKAYVQDRLWQARETAWEMLQAGGHVYVCGDARHMAKDVDATLVRIAREVGGMDGAAARAYVDGLSQANRYVQDVWAN